MVTESKFYNIYQQREGKKKQLYTKSLNPGSLVYGEEIVTYKGAEYRQWDPFRSKLASFILKGADQIAIKPGSVVLYLGASTGTTVSHVSDILTEQGFVFAVEFSPHTAVKLVLLAEQRTNIIPILADANRPDTYFSQLTEVDVVFQDVAQRNQLAIFKKNVDLYLKDGGFGLLAVKARSVDVTKKPKQVFEAVREELEKEYVVVDKRTLDPFQKDHMMFLVKKKR